METQHVDEEKQKAKEIEQQRIKDELKDYKRQIYRAAYYNDFMEKMNALEEQAREHQFTNIPLYRKAKALQEMMEWARSYIFDDEEDVCWLDDDELCVMEKQMQEEVKRAEDHVRAMIPE